MKNIVDFINEGNINESKYEVASCRAEGNMKYGYMFYEENLLFPKAPEPFPL